MNRGWTLTSRPGAVLAALGFHAARKAALVRAGIHMQSVWKGILNQPGSGKEYPRGLAFITHHGRVIPVAGTPDNPGRSRAHRASAPGEPPAPDTHALGQSIAVAEVGGDVRVGTGLRIGLALEYGVNVSGSRTGPHPGKNFVLQPRPHARPAGKAARKGMTRDVKYALTGVRRRGTLGG